MTSPGWPAARLNSNCQSREPPGRHMLHYSRKSIGKRKKHQDNPLPGHGLLSHEVNKNRLQPPHHPPASPDGLMSKTLNPHHHHHHHLGATNTPSPHASALPSSALTPSIPFPPGQNPNCNPDFTPAEPNQESPRPPRQDRIRRTHPFRSPH
jgi:hypothetical protein